MPTAEGDRHSTPHATYSKPLDLGQFRLTKLDEGKSGIETCDSSSCRTEVSKARHGRRRMVAPAAAEAESCAYLVPQVPDQYSHSDGKFHRSPNVWMWPVTASRNRHRRLDSRPLRIGGTRPTSAIRLCKTRMALSKGQRDFRLTQLSGAQSVVRCASSGDELNVVIA